MNKLDYLKKVILESELYNDKTWYISAFAILMKVYTDDSWKINAIRFSIIKTIDKLNFIDINEANEFILIPISDSKKDEPLFTFQELISVDNSWLPSIKSKLQTKLGNLIINKIVIYPSFTNKIDYINTPITVSELETFISLKLKNDNEATEKDITVKELTEFVDRLYFLTNLADITNLTATAKNITPPTGLKKVKQELYEKYKDELTNPVKLVEFENKLKDLDAEYLKDDPTASKIISKKSKVARKKMFLVFGSEKGFDESVEVKPIIKSLDEGVDTDEDIFPEYMNGLRYGSYARGAETVRGGVTYKILQRSLSNLAIVNEDCGTTKGLTRYINNNNYNKLVNRNIKISTKWLTINGLEEAKKYIGKEVEIRSSMYCKSLNNTLCYHCLSELYKDQSGGISTLAAEVSSVILGMFLSLMHGTEQSLVELNLKDIVT